MHCQLSSVGIEFVKAAIESNLCTDVPKLQAMIMSFRNFWIYLQSIFIMESVTPGRGTTSSEEQSTDGCCRYNWAWQLNLLECGYWRSKRPCKRLAHENNGTLDPEQLNAWSFAHSKNQSAALAFSWRRPCWFLHQIFFNFSTCTYSSYYTLAFFRSPFLSGVHQTTRLSWVIIDMYPTVATAVHAWDGNALRAHPNSLGLSWMRQTEQTFIMTLGVLELRRFGSLKPLQSNSIPFNPRELDQTQHAKAALKPSINYAWINFGDKRPTTSKLHLPSFLV